MLSAGLGGREVLSAGPGGGQVLSAGPSGGEEGRCCDLVLGGGRCCHLVPGEGREGGVVTWLPTSSPLPRVEVTHTCENITFTRFATRAVKINVQVV